MWFEVALAAGCSCVCLGSRLVRWLDGCAPVDGVVDGSLSASG